MFCNPLEKSMINGQIAFYKTPDETECIDHRIKTFFLLKIGMIFIKYVC